MKKIVVVGGVAGGMSAAARMRRLDATAEIVVLEKSGYVSYANCGLPYFVGGVISNEESLLLQTPESLFKRFRLDVRIGSDVLAIDRVRKVLSVKSSEKLYDLEYDYLILSPGASPIRPNLPGIDRAMTLRNIEDVERIAKSVGGNPRSAVVIGGGFIGVEIAENLVHRAISTHIVEAADQLLAPLDPEMATHVTNEMISHGVTLHFGSSVEKIGSDTVTLAGGEIIPAEIVILAIGVRPETMLAKASGIEIGPQGGIKTNDFNLTNDSAIYAIGDAAEKIDFFDESQMLVPLANIANRQGRIVADHIAGRPIRPVRAQATAIVKVFDLTVATSGWNEKKLKKSGKRYVAIHTHPSSHAGYYPGATGMSLKLLIDPESSEILGIQGVGRSGVDKRIDVIATAIRAGLTAPELADLELAYAPPFGSAKDPVNMLGYIAENLLTGLTPTAQWHEVEDLRTAGFSIVDVRSAQEFEQGAIPGSINISIDELRERISELPNGKLLLTCQVGQRGHAATRLLRELGYEATNLDGGYLTWRNSPAGKNR